MSVFYLPPLPVEGTYDTIPDPTFTTGIGAWDTSTRLTWVDNALRVRAWADQEIYARLTETLYLQPFTRYHFNAEATRYQGWTGGDAIRLRVTSGGTSVYGAYVQCSTTRTATVSFTTGASGAAVLYMYVEDDFDVLFDNLTLVAEPLPTLLRLSVLEDDDITWTNIIGTSHGITIDRDELSVGTMSATLFDADLHPAQSTLLRPGRAVQVAIHMDSTYPLFTGLLTNADVTYDTSEPGDPRAVITINAVDNISKLASAVRPSGVGLIDDLPHVIDGTGVDYNCNQLTSPGSAPAIVSYNESASALDQIAITRDSVGGFAWVDASGVLQAHDAIASTWTEGSNILTNGDLETNTAGWVEDSGNGTIVRSTADKHTGAASLLLTTNSSGFGHTLGPHVAVTAGEYYRLEAFTKPSKAVEATFAFYDSSHILMVNPPQAFLSWAASADWHSRSADTLAPIGAAYVGPYFRTSGSGGGTHSIFIDDVTIKPLTEGPGDYLGLIKGSLDEPTYTDIGLSYNTDACINEVTIRWLRFNSVTNETEEVLYGPYVDAASIATWGRHTAEFTMQGEYENATTIAEKADVILDANATPVIRVNSVTVSVMDETFLLAGTFDLYDLVTLNYTSAGFTGLSRITSIHHELLTDRWLVTYGFEVEGSVASPQQTPAIASANTEGTWLDVDTSPAFENSWVNYNDTPGYALTRFMRKNGIVYVQIMAKDGTLNSTIFTLPEGYRPAGDLICAGNTTSTNTGAASAGTAHTHPISGPTRFNIAASGAINTNGATGNDYTALVVSFPAEA